MHIDIHTDGQTDREAGRHIDKQRGNFFNGWSEYTDRFVLFCVTQFQFFLLMLSINSGRLTSNHGESSAEWCPQYWSTSVRFRLLSTGHSCVHWLFS